MQFRATSEPREGIRAGTGLQMSAHSLQISLLNLPSRLNTFAAAWQIAAHSRSNWIHFFTCATSSSFKQAMAH